MNTVEHMNKIRQSESKPYIQIPNNLVKEVVKTVRKYDKESYAHYAYSYMVLHGFLYKYTNYINIDSGEYLNVQDIKSILKYNPRNQRVDAISRREDGILEKEGFVESTRDIPISYRYEETSSDSCRKREIISISDASDDLSDYIYNRVLRTPNYFVAIPNYMTDSGKVCGTLNNYKNTFRLSYSEFEYFIFNDEYSLRDFFTYCYIKSVRNKKGHASVSFDTFKRQTGLSRNTVIKTIDKMKKLDVVKVTTGRNVDYRTKAPNIYEVKDSFIEGLEAATSI